MFFHSRRAASLVASALAFTAFGASAAALRVPADFATVQAAINAAQPGDEVLVDPGTYVENLNFIGKAITVRSAAGPQATTLDGGFNGQPVVAFVSGETRNAVLSGFTIRNGLSPWGAGVMLGGSSPTLVGNVFRANEQSAGGFGAAIGGNGSSPVIRQNLFTRNRCDTQFLSGVIAFVNGSSPLIADNVVVDNDCRGMNFTLPQDAAPVVVNNTLVGNPVGIYLDARVPASAKVFANNLLVDNAIGLQVEFFAGTGPQWRHNLVHGVGAAYQGIADPTGTQGNLAADPLFVNPARRNFNLRAGSPAIDAGSAQGVTVSTQDFNGGQRVQDGDRNGSPVVDIGAQEFVPRR